MRRAGNDGWRVEEALVRAELAAGDHFHVLVFGRARDEAFNAVALALGDQRADLVLGIVGLIEFDGRYGAGKIATKRS